MNHQCKYSISNIECLFHVAISDVCFFFGGSEPQTTFDINNSLFKGKKHQQIPPILTCKPKRPFFSFLPTGPLQSFVKTTKQLFGSSILFSAVFLLEKRASCLDNDCIRRRDWRMPELGQGDSAWRCKGPALRSSHRLEANRCLEVKTWNIDRTQHSVEATRGLGVT